jgi:GT2 family glycosyltransferase
MISIITAVYNQLPMNMLFYESISRASMLPWQLIVIDNGSTDGSAEFFEQQKNTQVIRNKDNYAYSYCQNQGIRASRFDYLAFLNNDIIVPAAWDKRLLECMQIHNQQVLTCSATERIENPVATRMQLRKWKWIKGLVGTCTGYSRFSLSLMHRLMYGNWQEYSENRYAAFGNSILPGFSGSSIMMHRGALDKIGMWDERIQAADFDLYLRLYQRNLDKGDINTLHFTPGIYMAHFIRLTLHQKFPPFINAQQLIPLEQKWDKEFMDKALSLIAL